ncbi:hypothetical protein J8273_8240 [Carpediemonas membranifera]|uniref:Uncharacterized protein n=1 Tax=Carpediemonas membranifera TaxID=201153 RepID=A0A8J6ARB1_9EUKA|nr:hypothetical protein J8273_8240 [Carpediemonas membranifera]|eukprot:KAG9390200.1 hypothetical protein J8273_8240 [Carpediemonas membranifera]
MADESETNAASKISDEILANIISFEPTKRKVAATDDIPSYNSMKNAILSWFSLLNHSMNHIMFASKCVDKMVANPEVSSLLARLTHFAERLQGVMPSLNKLLLSPSGVLHHTMINSISHFIYLYSSVVGKLLTNEAGEKADALELLDATEINKTCDNMESTLLELTKLIIFIPVTDTEVAADHESEAITGVTYERPGHIVNSAFIKAISAFFKEPEDAAARIDVSTLVATGPVAIKYVYVRRAKAYVRLSADGTLMDTISDADVVPLCAHRPADSVDLNLTDFARNITVKMAPEELEGLVFEVEKPLAMLSRLRDMLLPIQQRLLAVEEEDDAEAENNEETEDADDSSSSSSSSSSSDDEADEPAKAEEEDAGKKYPMPLPLLETPIELDLTKEFISAPPTAQWANVFIGITVPGRGLRYLGAERDEKVGKIVWTPKIVGEKSRRAFTVCKHDSMWSFSFDETQGKPEKRKRVFLSFGERPRGTWALERFDSDKAAGGRILFEPVDIAGKNSGVALTRWLKVAASSTTKRRVGQKVQLLPTGPDSTEFMLAVDPQWSLNDVAEFRFIQSTTLTPQPEAVALAEVIKALDLTIVPQRSSLIRLNEHLTKLGAPDPLPMPPPPPEPEEEQAEQTGEAEGESTEPVAEPEEAAETPMPETPAPRAAFAEPESSPALPRPADELEDTGAKSPTRGRGGAKSPSKKRQAATSRLGKTGPVVGRATPYGKLKKEAPKEPTLRAIPVDPLLKASDAFKASLPIPEMARIPGVIARPNEEEHKHRDVQLELESWFTMNKAALQSDTLATVIVEREIDWEENDRILIKGMHLTSAEWTDDFAVYVSLEECTRARLVDRFTEPEPEIKEEEPEAEAEKTSSEAASEDKPEEDKSEEDKPAEGEEAEKTEDKPANDTDATEETKPADENAEEAEPEPPVPKHHPDWLQGTPEAIDGLRAAMESGLLVLAVRRVMKQGEQDVAHYMFVPCRQFDMEVMKQNEDFHYGLLTDILSNLAWRVETMPEEGVEAEAE